LPGAEENAVSDRAALPLAHGQNDLCPRPLIREGQDVQSSQPPLIDTSIVSPEYFHGTTLLRGRLFVDQDLENTPSIAVVNQAALHAYWPNQNPVGKRPAERRQAGLDHHRRRHCRRTHGVARGRRHSAGLTRHLPAPRHVSCVLPAWTGRSRRRLVAGAHASPVRRSELPVFRAETLDDVLSSSFSVQRFAMKMVAMFAGTALFLAGLGIYGTISFLVNE
jgi:hypothetical protein